MSKLNFNATGTQITNESHSDVGASEFVLEHGLFLASGFAVTKSGAPLTYGTDFILTTINERLRTEAGITAYQKIKVLNVTYQTGELIFTYKAVGDFIEAEDWSTANTKIDKATNVTTIDDTGIADGEIAVFNLTAKSIKTSDKVFSTDGTLAGNSDANIPTEKAVKTYADTKMEKAQNLNDVADKATARSNLDVYSKTESNGTTGTGYAKLPGGLIVQWGSVTAASAGDVTVSLPTAFVGTVYSVNITLIDDSDTDNSPYDIKIRTKSTTSFNFRTTLASKTYQWIAIGY